MIPKKIHYCWFGPAPKGEVETKCIESWKKSCRIMKSANGTTRIWKNLTTVTYNRRFRPKSGLLFPIMCVCML